MIAVLIWVVFFCNWSGFSVGVNEEGVALLAFKEAIKEDPENALSNWNTSDENPCSWNGVSCKDNKVVSLSIPRKQLKGLVPSVLGSLSFLRHINLRNNKLEGSLPNELSEPQGLQSLVFYGNNISGPLPSQIGKLRYLQILDLSENMLNGSIPTSLLDCKRLKNLILSRNNFTDALPHGFGSSFPSLEKLNLSNNRLSGSIPSDFGNLVSLKETFDLSHNFFSGSIPPSLGNLPERVYIDLTYNNLSGLIPQNGALVNRGPTAFVGNPLLCGPPLKNLCSPTNPSSNIPYLPKNYPPQPSESSEIGSKNRGLSRNTLIAILASCAVAIALIVMLFFYCYCKLVSSQSRDETGNSQKEETKGKKECLCFCKDESETFSDNVEQFDLVPLDLQVGYDLDELLRASAFVLGKSGIGIVYKIILDNGLTLAVRRLGEGGSQRFKEFQTEVEAIGKIRHPNIVTLRAYYWSVDEKLLIYDYIPNGNLATAIHGNAGMNTFTPPPWYVRLKIIKGIANGLAYLHEFSPKKYVHGALKPTNILLGSNMEPYISDFGLGMLANIAGGSPRMQSNRIAESKENGSSEISGGLVMNSGSCYQAPEALKVLKPSQKWDIYSFGVILVEIFSGKSPMVLLGTSEMDLVRWVQFCIEEKMPLSDILDPVLVEDSEKEEEIVAVLKIALACVQNNAERRPSMRHVSYALDRLTESGEKDL